ncbi:MAG: imidazoleglycerol-phosphate dehydratase HisB [Polyangiales bacterium]
MSRKAELTRTTSETDIRIELDLDGRGRHEIKTPLPFLTHMVEQLSRHGLFDLKVDAKGDTEIDGHHTTEDLGITLGRTFAKALGQRVGIRRYGWATLPMDEARVTCTLDLSGRTFFVWRVPMPKTKIGQFDTELAEVFFEGFARGAECNLHLVLEEGENLHHIVEITFKAFAKALRIATEIDPRAPDTVPSTKGTLTE